MRRGLIKVSAAALLGVAAASALSASSVFRSLENRAHDAFFHFRGPVAESSGQIVLVAIDEPSVQRLGIWPWPRTDLARLVRKIKDGSPKVLGIDLLLDIPGRVRQGEDEALAGALEGPPPSVIAVVVDESDGPKRGELLFRPLDIFLEGEARTGVVNILNDPVDKTAREYRAAFGDHLSYPVTILEEFLGAGEGNVETTDDAVRIGYLSAPLRGGRGLVNFRGVAVDAIAAADVLEDFFEPSFFFKDKIVLVGRTDLASHDTVNTPVSSGRLFSTVSMYGVEVWGEIIDMMLRGDFLRRAPFAAVAAAMLALAAAVAAATLLSTRAGAAALAAAALAVPAGSYQLFVRAGVVAPVLGPVLAAALAYGGLFMYAYLAGLKERRVLSSAFGSYVSPHVLEGILSKKISLDAGGKRKKLTMLFLDIRGFSDFVDSAEPEDVMEYVKAFFAEMNRIVTKHGGTVDKMLGDGLLAVYGDFTGEETQADDAVAAALEMQARAVEMAGTIGHGLAVRLGVNTGYVTVGNVGSEEHLDYTVIGRAVGLAKRLESACEPGKVLISDATLKMLKAKVEPEKSEEITVKGFARPVKVHLIAPRRDEGARG